jgi:hypothetical protein
LPANSTAVDRIALYVIPLQLVVGAHLPGARLFGLTPKQMMLAALGFCVAVEFVWLNFAVHASYWLPYANVLGLY